LVDAWLAVAITNHPTATLTADIVMRLMVVIATGLISMATALGNRTAIIGIITIPDQCSPIGRSGRNGRSKRIGAHALGTKAGLTKPLCSDELMPKGRARP